MVSLIFILYVFKILTLKYFSFFGAYVNNIALFFLKINLFIYFWLCWLFVSVRGLSLVAASGGHSSFTIAASLVAEHRLQTRRLSSCGSRA